jgi:DNA-directed RNA polymerase specialized sigma24 family protein
LEFASTFYFFTHPIAKSIDINPEQHHLLQSLREGDEKALKAIFMLYHSDLCRVAYRVLRDEERSKDVVQDVFLKIWVRRKELDITFSLAAYLRRAVVNASINMLQQKTHVLVAGELPEQADTSSSDPQEKSGLSGIAHPGHQGH